MSAQSTPVSSAAGLKRGLGLFDSTMIVAGSMIGSGIFIVAAEMSRQLGSTGWLLASWVITGVLTIAAALSYGELASMMPRAGGQYVYLREAFSPLWGFLYGWTLFLVIQTGTIAAVAIGFARYLGTLEPAISESSYIVPPIHLGSSYAVSLSTAQLIAVLLILLLTWTNTRGLDYGKIVQNVFTTAKIGSLAALILVGLILGWNAHAISANFSSLWSRAAAQPIVPGLNPATALGLLVAMCVAQVGSLFSSDAWNNITFTAGEVRNPNRNVPLSLAFGTILVTSLYLLANLAYFITLPLSDIQHAPSDRVASTMLAAIFPRIGGPLIAVAIMISTFGCINGMILSGARAYFAMARDGLFLPKAATLNKASVPGAALAMQGVWGALLILMRTYDSRTGTYGNLYSNLLDYVISAALMFYILTIAGIFRLRRLRPEAERPYKAFGYPIVPVFYMLGAAVILIVLLIYRPATTWPGFLIVFLGVPVYLLFRRSRVSSNSK
ncbi:MAG TPA: amino acid permease [Bryobacteraceae bacterium]|jgi:APA family basic amino acid/polyamine antiporter|nr:amino acid permease [Bryobacteraceae bacterium]